MTTTWKRGSVTVLSTTLAITVLALVSDRALQGQSGATSPRDADRRMRFTSNGPVEPERQSISVMSVATEALAGYDNQTNGFNWQGPAFDSLNEDNVVALRSFNDNRFIFEEVEKASDGLGPTYNAQSCRECHQNVVTGGASQITEQRTGHLLNGTFFESQGGSLIQSRAIVPEATELVSVGDDVRTFRMSTSILGAGFVEAIANSMLEQIRNNQPSAMRGTAIVVPVLEANGQSRIGRFGWKAQHASLQSFAADAYLNEMGITSPLLPVENSISGVDVSKFDPVADPEDDGDDVLAFANFMRATKAPSRGPITTAVRSGEQLFRGIGCVTCHVASITTSPAGTVINGGKLVVPAALGDKIIHPYSDYLLHNIASGDGIPIQPTAEFAGTANQIRTAPLWGLRTRNRLMHDGLSFTRQEAILRHGGQAAAVRRQYQALSSTDQANLIAFLNSL